MADEKTSVLAKKIHAAKSSAASSSDISGFALQLAKITEKKTGELLEAEAVANASTQFGELGALLAGGADPGVYYWIADASGEPALLFSVAPGFANTITARLLGGELNATTDMPSASGVDFDMASALVDIMMEPVGALLQRTSKNVRLPAASRRGMQTLKEVLRERDRLPAAAITFDLDFEGKAAPKAFNLIFTASFLERAGVMQTSAKPAAVAGADWQALLRRNVLNTEIPLSVVLDRVATSVGDLSRLAVGQIIDLSPNALARLDICATTASGPVSVARGRLGALQARKAVKLTTGVDENFLYGL
jgi:flagellar motor switch protein FliM